MLTHGPAAQRHHPPLLSVNELAVKKSVTLAPKGSGKFLWNIGRSKHWQTMSAQCMR